MHDGKLGNMKKKYSKIYIMFFTLLLCLLCNGCTEKKNNEDVKIEVNNEIVLIKTMLNNSIVSEDVLTPDEMVSNTILEKTEINLIEEYLSADVRDRSQELNDIKKKIREIKEEIKILQNSVF